MSFAELAARLPEWGRLFDASAHEAFLDAVRGALIARGAPFELFDDYARIGGAWDFPLLPLAQKCAATGREAWGELIRAEIEERSLEEQLGRELDAVRGDFSRAQPVLKLRIQKAETLSAGTISAPIAGGLHAVLVLDLPSFITPVRAADLAAWERPADQLVRIALDNVKAQEQIDMKPMEVAGTKVFAISGKSLFVATLGLAADDLLGAPTPFGALVAMPSGHILLCHSIVDKRSLRALEAIAAGSMQAFESGPSPLSPDLLWKRGDRYVALTVRREGKDVKVDLPKEFDDEVVEKLS